MVRKQNQKGATPKAGLALNLDADAKGGSASSTDKFNVHAFANPAYVNPTFTAATAPEESFGGFDDVEREHANVGHTDAPATESGNAAPVTDFHLPPPASGVDL